jgi:hypothetical protein
MLVFIGSVYHAAFQGPVRKALPGERAVAIPGEAISDRR